MYRIFRHNSNPILQNSKNLCKYRNKVLSYYNLLRGPKEEDAEHPDIVKFRQFYNHRRPISTSALKHEDNFDFQPDVHPSSKFEEQNDFPGSKSQSPVKQEFKSCYFTPLVSLENCANFDNLPRVRQCDQNSVFSNQKCSTINDLIKFNNSPVDDTLFQQKPSSKYYNYSADSSEMSCLAAGTSISAMCSDFPDLQPGSPVLPDKCFSAREASKTNSFISSDCTIDICSSSFAPDGLYAMDLQYLPQQYSSNLPEKRRLLRSPASAFDSCTFPNIDHGNAIRMNNSPAQVTEREASGCQYLPKSDCENFTNLANTSSPPIASSQDNSKRDDLGLPENDTIEAPSAGKIKNDNSSSSGYMANGLPYIECLEGSKSLYKYYHVPEKYSVAEKKPNASGEKKTDSLIVIAPVNLDTPVEDGKTEIECKENTITDKCTHAKDENSNLMNLDDSTSENPLTAKFPSSPDSFMEEISFSPDEDSDTDNTQNAVLNVRVVETSPYKILGDSSCSSSPVSD